MSDTEHFKGKLIPTGKTLIEFDPSADDIGDHYREAVEIDGLIYRVEKITVDPYMDIFNANKNIDGSISFEVKYYNGGCSFDEAIYHSLSKMGLSDD